MIAPFWADLDLTNTANGNIWYKEYSRSSGHIGVEPIDAQSQSIFAQAEHDVEQVRGDISFRPTNVIIVTWQEVHPHDSNQHYNNQVGYQL